MLTPLWNFTRLVPHLFSRFTLVRLEPIKREAPGLLRILWDWRNLVGLEKTGPNPSSRVFPPEDCWRASLRVIILSESQESG